MQGNESKIVIIGLVVIVLVFAATIFLGTGNGSGHPADLDSGWIEGIQQTFARPQPLDLREVKPVSTALPACRQAVAGRLTVPAGVSCQFQIDKSNNSTRRLRLKLDRGMAVLALDQKVQGKDAVTVKQTLPNTGNDPNNPDFLDVYQEGGVLVISCRPATGVSVCQLVPI